MELRPYKQEIDDDCIYREFKSDVDENDLVWHRDKRDRTIESMHITDWMIQFDNELPQIVEGTIDIPKEVYHRLIKGTGNLTLKIKEH